MAEEEVRASLRRSPAVGALRQGLEEQIASGHLSALEGVQQLLGAWRSDVTSGQVGLLDG